jgi:high-affinity Fe2+/Pb2+ permease
MATIVNTPAGTNSDSSGGAGFLIGAIVLLVIVVLLFMYGLPMLRNAGGSAPSAPTSGTQLNIPDKVNVDVNNK